MFRGDFGLSLFYLPMLYVWVTGRRHRVRKPGWRWLRRKLPAIAIDELLDSAHWGEVRFFFVVQQGKRFAEFAEFTVQFVGAIALDRQAAALAGAIFGEGGDNDVAAWFDRA